MKKLEQCNPVLIPWFRLGNAKHNHYGFPGRSLGSRTKNTYKKSKSKSSVTPFTFPSSSLGMQNTIITESQALAWEAELKVHIKNEKVRAV